MPAECERKLSTLFTIRAGFCGDLHCMSGIRNISVLYLLGLCLLLLFKSLVASQQEVTLTLRNGEDNANHVVIINEICFNQGNLRRSGNKAIVEDAIFYFVSSIEKIDRKYLNDMNSGCESLHDVTSQFIATGNNLEQLKVELQCEIVISSLDESDLLKSVVSFALTVSAQNMDNKYIIECLLSIYQITLNNFMQDRMYIPRLNDKYSMAVQIDHSIIIQANDTDTTVAPTMVPTTSSDEGLFTTKTIMTLGIFFIGLIVLICLICFITTRRSMNKIVVGIG